MKKSIVALSASFLFIASASGEALADASGMLEGLSPLTASPHAGGEEEGALSASEASPVKERRLGSGLGGARQSWVCTSKSYCVDAADPESARKILGAILSSMGSLETHRMGHLRAAAGAH